MTFKLTGFCFICCDLRLRYSVKSLFWVWVDFLLWTGFLWGIRFIFKALRFRLSIVCWFCWPLKFADEAGRWYGSFQTVSFWEFWLLQQTLQWHSCTLQFPNSVFHSPPCNAKCNYSYHWSNSSDLRYPDPYVHSFKLTLPLSFLSHQANFSCPKSQPSIEYSSCQAWI